ncbi:hypothetical protein GCM10007242_33490 [Pigmentiphaga litoralis]|nr:hypothetical protein GCM10007242_33490 [Pigmentiphaga litoralis]
MSFKKCAKLIAPNTRKPVRSAAGVAEAAGVGEVAAEAAGNGVVVGEVGMLDCMGVSF